MTKKPAQPQDKYVLRLPDGLRDRIKTYAQRHGRSMNAEIVRILEREFPEPWSVDGRVSDLLEMLRVLRAGATDVKIDQLTHEIEETVVGMMTGRIKGLNEEAMSNISELWNRYCENRLEDENILSDLDDEEYNQFEISGRTSKYIHPEGNKNGDE